MIRSKSTPFGLLATGIIIVCLIPFIYAAFFPVPEGDDFYAATRAKHLFDIIGGIDYMGSAWWKWSGRYFFSFLWIFLGDVVESRTATTLGVLASFFLFWISSFGIAKELGENKCNKQASFFASMWLFALLCTHGALSGWYFWVEILTLSAGHSFVLLYIWSLCKLWNAPTVTSKNKWFCILSGIAAAGCYEHSALLTLIVSLGSFLLAHIYQHPHKKTFFLLTKIASVCFLLVYLARGNFRRQAKRDVTFDIMLQQILNMGAEWKGTVLAAFYNPIILVCLWTAGWFKGGWKTPLTQKTSLFWCIAGGLVTVFGYTLAITCVHALSDITVSEVPKIPANILQYSTILIMFFLFACQKACHITLIQGSGKVIGLILLLTILLSGTNNFRQVFANGLTGAYPHFEQVYAKRKAVFATESQATVVKVLPPFPLYPDTLLTQAKDWPNKYAAPFYGIEGIKTINPDPTSVYEQANKQPLQWTQLSDTTRMFFSPASPQETNESLRFDWIFLQAPTLDTAHARAVPLFCQVSIDLLTQYTSLQQNDNATAWHSTLGSEFILQNAQTMPLLTVDKQQGIYAIPLYTAAQDKHMALSLWLYTPQGVQLVYPAAPALMKNQKN